MSLGTRFKRQSSNTVMPESNNAGSSSSSPAKPVNSPAEEAWSDAESLQDAARKASLRLKQIHQTKELEIQGAAMVPAFEHALKKGLEALHYATNARIDQAESET